VAYSQDGADKTAWFKVNNVTSATRSEEDRRQAEYKNDKSSKGRGKKSGLLKKFLTKSQEFSSVDAMFDFVLLEQAKESSKRDMVSIIQTRENLEINANRAGYQVRAETEGDGNCLFAAIHDQLERVGISDFTPATLRVNIVGYLRKHPRMDNGTELFSFVNGHQSWEAYLSSMSRSGTWGDHLVLRAASEMLRMRLLIISSVNLRGL
jgi:hypothetical protein